ncbi:protein kinase [Nonomuraea sp. NPDC059023]|uniref:protein kinase domain-containing protein n=1 Tax=unclassified Nonomuraea TaxID=2593643 RepID=UPI0036757568
MPLGDPRQLGDYTLEHVLAEGPAGVVYAGRGPDGERVAVKLLHTDLEDPERFLERAEGLKRVDAFHSAMVLDAGIEGARPYVVSEFVDGVSLKQAVIEHGPLGGAALHRLAIATMTALAAIHQAGLAHGALRPDNVLLGPDGPRVINAGVGAAVESGSAIATQQVSSPAFLAPEQFAGELFPVSADLFAWGSTVVFAATGQSPFHSNSMSAAMNRILREEPDLGGVADPPRAIVAACLAKDPAARPTASEALMRLVGHSMLTDLPPVLEEEPPRRSRAPALVAAALALAVLSAAGGHAVARVTRPAPAPAKVVSAAPAPGPASPSPDVRTAAPDPSPPPKPTKTVKAVGIGLTLHESPDDPVVLSAYRVGKDAYVREGDTFTKLKTPGADLGFSPDGQWLAIYAEPTLTVVNRKTKEQYALTPEVKGKLALPTWSPDSKRLLLSIVDGGDPELALGFVLVDPVSRSVTPVPTDDKAERIYAWLPDSSGVVIDYRSESGWGLKARDLAGRELWTKHWVGQLWGRRSFSPSGASFLTLCPSGGSFCLWNTQNWGRQESVAVFGAKGGTLLSWYDDSHLIITEPRDKDKAVHRIIAIDLRGRTQRVMGELAGKDDRDDLIYVYTGR